MKRAILLCWLMSCFIVGWAVLANDTITICVNIWHDYSQKITSLSIAPYTNGWELDADKWSKDKNCMTMSYENAKSFFETDYYNVAVEWVDKNWDTHLLEERSTLLFGGWYAKNKITLSYDIFSIPTDTGDKLIGSVSNEQYIYNDGNISNEKHVGFSLQGSALIFPVQTMYWLRATKYDWDSQDSYKSAGNLTREQAAKFFVQTARKLWLSENVHTAVTYKDSKNIDPTLVDYVTTVQKMGIMVGWNGYFNPQGTISLAEAVTILMRMKYGKLDETGSPWYLHYFEKAYALNLLQGYHHNPHIILDANYPINRGMIAELISTLLRKEGVEIPNRYGI